MRMGPRYSTRKTVRQGIWGPGSFFLVLVRKGNFKRGEEGDVGNRGGEGKGRKREIPRSLTNILLWSRRPVDDRTSVGLLGIKLPSLPFVIRRRWTEERALVAMDR